MDARFGGHLDAAFALLSEAASTTSMTSAIVSPTDATSAADR